MKKLTVLILAAIIPLSIHAQPRSDKFGRVSEEEVRMTSYDKDPQAEALYIYDKKDLSFLRTFQYDYNVYVRVKIFSKNALSLADVEIPFYSAKSSESITGVAANTYNIVDGKMVKTPMPKQNIFTEKLSADFSVIKFSLPEVREGSVIEYKYNLRTVTLAGISDFTIQHKDPVLHSVVEIKLPEFIGYSVNSRGSYSLNMVREPGDDLFSLGAMNYNMNRISCRNDDVPSLRDEPMVWCLDDFLAGFDLEITGINIPEANIYENFAVNWESINETLGKSELGSCQKARNPFKDEVAAIRAKDTTETAKMHDVLKLVSGKIKYNGKAYLIPDSPGSVVKKGTGSMADLNNILSIALRDCGFKNDLILLKPRHEGRLPYFPSLQKISSFIVRAEDSEGNFYYMDASDKDSDLNVLSPELLVDKARIYNVNGNDGWVNLSALVKNSDQTMIIASLEDDGRLKGHFNRILTNQKAYSFNERHEKADSEDAFIEDIAKDSHVAIDSCSFSGVGTMRVIETVHFSKDPERAGDHIYINPTLTPFMTENPFSEQVRKLPVEFETIENNTVQFTMTIPDGYTVEEIPPACNYTGCGGDVQFTFFHRRIGNNLMTRLNLRIDRVLFGVDEYSDLNQLFGKIAELSNSRIVLKKASE